MGERNDDYNGNNDCPESEALEISGGGEAAGESGASVEEGSVVTAETVGEESAIPEGGEGAAPLSASPEEVRPAKPASSKKSKIKKIIWNVVLVAVLALGVFSLFGITKEIGHTESGSFVEVMSNVSPLYACIFVAVVIAIMITDSAKYCIITKTVTGKVHFSASVKTNFLGRYYDAVTPFSTGGQPMQIIYLNSKGMSGGNSSAIVLIKYISSILCWIALGGALMIYGSATGALASVPSRPLILQVCGWIGIGVNLIVPMFVLLFIIFPKVMNKLTGGVVKLGNKMRIVKSVDKTTAKALKVVDDFKSSFKIMATTPLNLVLLILVSFAESFFTFSVPFFVMKAFSCDIDWTMLLTVMSLNAFATFGASFVPTPGNAGVIEGMGAVAFTVAAGFTVTWSVLFWRLGVYYVYIIIGLIITVRDIIKRNLKRRANREAEGTESALSDAAEDAAADSCGDGGEERL